MFQKHSMAGRVAMSKAIGFIVGGIVFFTLPALGADYSLEFGIGVWLYIMLMSVTIGVMGMFTQHPVLGFRMHWWFRGAVLGAVYHLVLVLLAHSEVQALFTLEAFAWTGLTSPYWILVDGAILGLIIGGLATRYIGEGDLPIT